jgi:hypothetical protein
MDSFRRLMDVDSELGWRLLNLEPQFDRPADPSLMKCETMKGQLSLALGYRFQDLDIILRRIPIDCLQKRSGLERIISLFGEIYDLWLNCLVFAEAAIMSYSLICGLLFPTSSTSTSIWFGFRGPLTFVGPMLEIIPCLYRPVL